MTVNKNPLDMKCKALLLKAKLPADPTIPFSLQLVQWALDLNRHPEWSPPIPHSILYMVQEAAFEVETAKPETILRLLATDAEGDEPLHPAIRLMADALPDDPADAASQLADTYWRNLTVFAPSLQATPIQGSD